MNFLYPVFLFALVMVVIPIIIHLFNFRKFKEVYFSNVAFLKEVKAQQSSREQLKNLLILCARILVIVFLVFAFARPFLTTQTTTDLSKGNIVSIYIDNSYSMDAVNKEGSLLDEAKRRAKDVVNSYQINDKFQLLTNDFEGKHQRHLNRDELIQALEEVKISSANRTLQQVLNRQESVFTGNSNRVAYIISDFQKGFAGADKIKKDNETQVSLVQLNSNQLPNIAVDSLWLLSPVHEINSSEKLVVRLKNYGDAVAKNVAIKLTINDQQKAISNVNIAANSTLLDTLSYSGLNTGWQKGKVGIKDFPITFDDELVFSFNVKANQQLLAINGQDNRYLKALFAADEFFKLTDVAESNINYSEFGNYNMIILNGLANPSSGLAQELKKYLSNGGSVVIFPNTTGEIVVLAKFLAALNLPVASQLITAPTRVAQIELQNPLFAGVFEMLPKNIDLPQVNRYYAYTERNQSGKEMLLQLPAGKSFLSKYRVANGQVYLAATSLDEKDGNLAKHPLFVPLMYRMAFVSGQDFPLFYVLAKDNVIILPRIKFNAKQPLKVIGDGFDVIPDTTQQNGKTLLYVADQIKKSGFYEVKKTDSALAVVAFNQDRIESNMNYDTKTQLQERFGLGSDLRVITAKTDSISSAIAEKNNGTELWKLCLILSLVFVATEILLVRFLNSTKNKIDEPVN